AAFAARSDRPGGATGITLPPLQRTVEADHLRYTHLTVTLDRDLATASFLIQGPRDMPPQTPEAIHAAGASFWPLALARELDDAILHLRLNEGDIGTWVFHSSGDPDLVAAYDDLLLADHSHWLV